MTVKTMEPVGEDVSTLAPPRLSTRNAAPRFLRLVGEGEHVHRRATEAVEGGDHKCVANVECSQGEVELRPACSSTRDPVVDVEVVAPDAGAEEIVDLTVGRLVSGRYPRVANQLTHSDLECVSQPMLATLNLADGCET